MQCCLQLYTSLWARPFLRGGRGKKRKRSGDSCSTSVCSWNPSSLDFGPELLGLAPRLALYMHSTQLQLPLAILVLNCSLSILHTCTHSYETLKATLYQLQNKIMGLTGQDPLKDKGVSIIGSQVLPSKKLYEKDGKLPSLLTGIFNGPNILIS